MTDLDRIGIWSRKCDVVTYDYCTLFMLVDFRAIFLFHCKYR